MRLMVLTLAAVASIVTLAAPCFRSGSLATCSGKTLTATVRSRRASVAL
jgi:hypothetical protein